MKKKSGLILFLTFIFTIQILIMPANADKSTDSSSSAAETKPAIVLPDRQPIQNLPYVEGEDSSVLYGCHSIDAMSPLGGSSKKLKTAKAALLYEQNSETMLYSYRPDERVYPASLVKIMTVLLAIENCRPEQTITVTSSALASIPADAIKIGLEPGEKLTVRDLLYLTMLESANDAAAVLAETAFGDQEKFVTKMNQRAAELGCSGTHFTNALGLHDELQYTTARDMAKILKAALERDDFRRLFGTERYTVPANNISKEREIVTTNHFMSKEDSWKYFDKRVTGGKSGAIGTKDRSVICTVENDELNLLCVVMGAEGIEGEEGYGLEWLGNFEEATELYNYGFHNYMIAQILYERKSVAQFPVENGANHVVGRPVKTVFSALPNDTTVDQLSWRYHQSSKGLTAPISKESSVGTVQVYYGNVCLAQSDMVSMNSSKVADPSRDAFNHQDGSDHGAWDTVLKVMGILFGILLGLAALWMTVKIIRGYWIRSRRKKMRHNRQRRR